MTDVAAPVFVGLEGPHEAGTFLVGFGGPPGQECGAPALCSWTLPKRAFQSEDLLVVTPTQGGKRAVAIAVVALQERTKSTSRSRVS